MGIGQSKDRVIKVSNPQRRLSKDEMANLKEAFNRIQDGQVRIIGLILNIFVDDYWLSVSSWGFGPLGARKFGDQTFLIIHIGSITIRLHVFRRKNILPLHYSARICWPSMLFLSMAILMRLRRFASSLSKCHHWILLISCSNLSTFKESMSRATLKRLSFRMNKWCIVSMPKPN